MKKKGQLLLPARVKRSFPYIIAESLLVYCLLAYTNFVINFKSLGLIFIPSFWLIYLYFLTNSKLSKKDKRELKITTIYLAIFTAVLIYRFISPIPIILASTPSPNPPSVTDSPDPQQGGSAITFSCSSCTSGAAGEYMKLLICKSNTDACVLGSQWSYRRLITIDNTQNSNTLSDYQVLVTVDTASLISAGKMRSDCGDIRFTDSDGTQLSYWIESGCNSADTKIWVKVPSIPAGSIKIIYMYYGNPDAISASNGDATFILFDDFDGTSLDTNKWETNDASAFTVSGGKINCVGNSNYPYLQSVNNVSVAGQSIATTVKMTVNSLGGTGYSGFRITYRPTRDGVVWYAEGSYDRYVLFQNSGQWAPGTDKGLTTGDIRETVILEPDKITQKATGARTIDDSWAGTTTNEDKTLRIFGTYTNYNIDVYWVFVRKYSYPEPTTSVGAEETNTASDYIWTQSAAVESNSSATYTCPSCNYSTNTYYGVSYNTNQAVWTLFTGAQTFTCKKENTCSCSGNVECYSGACKADPDGSGAFCCNSNQCAHDGACSSIVELVNAPGGNACIEGENIAHNSAGIQHPRYAAYDGQLYYCGTSTSDKSPYSQVTNLVPTDRIGNCQCKFDGNFNCSQQVITIRGGRVRIVP